MKPLFLLLAIVTISTIACSKNDTAPAKVSVEEACAANFKPSGGAEVSPSILTDGRPGTWKVSKVDVFQSLKNSNNNKFGVIGYTVHINPNETTHFTKICADNTPGEEMDFNYGVGAVINRSTGIATKKVKGEITGSAEKGYSHRASFSSSTERFRVDDVPGTTAKFIQLQGENLEMNLSIPVKNGSTTGIFIFRARMEFVPAPVAPTTPPGSGSNEPAVTLEFCLEKTHEICTSANYSASWCYDDAKRFCNNSPRVSCLEKSFSVCKKSNYSASWCYDDAKKICSTSLE